MTPRRIVSLVPSLTELVWWLGAGDRLVGRTRFCTEPEGEIEGVPAFGGTKKPNIERIVNAMPDLVIVNKEENRREDVEALRSAGLNVLLTDPNSVEEALEMVASVGALLEAKASAARLIEETRSELRPVSDEGVRVFVAVWRNPLMGMGAGTFGDSILGHAGGVNVLAGETRYPETSVAALAELQPAVILLPDEPYPFAQTHLSEFTGISRARVVDGKLIWWYGHRMPAALRELRRVLAEEGGR